MKIVNRISILALTLSLAGCAKPGSPDLTDKNAQSTLLREGHGSALALTFDGELVSDPNIYSLSLQFESQTLELIGEVKNKKAILRDLPVEELLSIEGALYQGQVKLKYKSHHCEKVLEQAAPLVHAETAEVSLDCFPLENIGKHGRATMNLPTKELGASFVEMSQEEVVRKVVELHPANQRVILTNSIDGSGMASLNLGAKQVIFNMGGDLVFRGAFAGETQSQNPSSDQGSFLALLNGQGISLDLVYGNKVHLTSVQNGTLRRVGELYMFKPRERLLVAMQVELVGDDGEVLFSGLMKEDHGSQEFTVVSYNVENLFDQEDNDYNHRYGDYRLSPNERGQYGNYGESVVFEGQERTYTEVKALGVKRVLTSIDPLGPEIVALQEVENDNALQSLRDVMAGMGYEMVFSGEPEGVSPRSIGTAVLSRFPIVAKDLVPVVTMIGKEPNRREKILRPILKVTVQVAEHTLVIYTNHWRSKGSPESMRVDEAKALKADVDSMLAMNPKQDFIITGDLNSYYNENIVIEGRQNDTDGVTGINSILKAQGDELKLVKRGGGSEFYNMHYELPRARRRTAWHSGYGWSAFDHMIVNKNVYDRLGVTYFDNTFMIARPDWPAFKYLFKADGTTNRWSSRRNGNYTEHAIGGYSDHLPVFARYRVEGRQSYKTLRLYNPGKPDHTDR